MNMNMSHVSTALALAAVLASCGGDSQPGGDNVGGLNQACRATAPACNTGLTCVGQICVLSSNTTTPDAGMVFRDTGASIDFAVSFDDSQADGLPSDADPVDGAANDADASPCGSCDPGPCEEAQCVADKCVYVRKKADSPCLDDDPCTYGGRCNASGKCINSDTLVCPDGSGFCGGKGKCEQVDADKSKCAADYPNLNKPCDDENDCTTETKCVPGTDGKGACEGRPLDARVPCDDHDGCTQPDECDGKGHCVGSPRKGWFEVAALPVLKEGSKSNDWDGWRSLTQNPGKSATWVADGRIRQIELSGQADAGGYCYAWWGTGYAKVGSRLGEGLAARCSVDDELCPTAACSGKPEFDNKGNVAVCARDRTDGTDIDPKVSKVDIAEGTKLHFDMRRRYGNHNNDKDSFSCKIRLSCEQ